MTDKSKAKKQGVEPKGGGADNGDSNGAAGAGMVRSRTRTGRNGLYIEVTAAQNEVIRQIADREGLTIKDALIGGLMARDELEAKCAAMSTFVHDVQAMLVAASTERALTKEEAQLFVRANALARNG